MRMETDSAIPSSRRMATTATGSVALFHVRSVVIQPSSPWRMRQELTDKQYVRSYIPTYVRT